MASDIVDPTKGPNLLRIRWLYHDLLDKLPTNILLSLNLCPCCHRHSLSISKRPTRTMYPDSEDNYETSCLDCFEQHDEYWNERWQEYYSGVM